MPDMLTAEQEQEHQAALYAGLIAEMEAACDRGDAVACASLSKVKAAQAAWLAHANPHKEHAPSRGRPEGVAPAAQGTQSQPGQQGARPPVQGQQGAASNWDRARGQKAASNWDRATDSARKSDWYA